jgi:hypothetical protein
VPDSRSNFGPFDRRGNRISRGSIGQIINQFDEAIIRLSLAVAAAAL